MTTNRTGRRRDVKQTPLDWAVEGLLAATLVFLPLAYGTTQPWSRETYFALVAATGLCALLRSVLYGDRLLWTCAYLPIVLFIGLTVLQRVPLPRGVLSTVSPHTLAMKDEFLAGLATPPKTTLTFYALATDRQLRLVLAVATVFAVVVQTCRTPERRRRLLMSMAAAGMAVALVAAYQDLSHADKIYGTVPVGHKNSGPFQNYSHFSQFMNLSIGAAVAWLLVSLAGWSNHWRDAAAAREQVLMAENAFVWPAAALAVGGPLLVFASMSRMGMISMLAAGAVTAGLLGWRGRPASGRRRRSDAPVRRGASLFYVATFAVAVVALLSIVGFDWVFDRLATVRTQHEQTLGGRGEVLRDLVPLWKQFPLLGTGLGTYEFVFPLFNRQTSTGLFTHAENEYAQLMAEAGGLGVALAAAFVGIVATAFVRVVRSPQRPEQYAAFGLGFGLIAILIHSASDFGQHVPANATLTAVCCGLLVCLSQGLAADKRQDGTPVTPAAVRPDSVRQNPAAQRPAWGRLRALRPVVSLVLKLGAALVFVAACVWVLHAAHRETIAARDFDDGFDPLTDIAAGRATADDFARVAAATAAAHAESPADMIYAYWSGVARWYKLANDATDPASGQLQLTEARLGEVRGIVAALDAARLLCPTYGPPLGLAGQLRARVFDDPTGDAQIKAAFRLTPHDRELCRLAGLLAVQERRWDDAQTILARYVRLGGPMALVVDAFCAANRPDLAQVATAGDWRNLKRLGDGLVAGWPKEQARAAACLAEADRLLVHASDAPDAPAELCFERGRLEDRNGRAADAVSWYQKAVDAAYDQADWHLALAKSLLAVGRTDDAERELRICLRQHPNWDEPARLLTDHRRRPDPAATRAAPDGR